jgi:hypothetical protein
MFSKSGSVKQVDQIQARGKALGYLFLGRGLPMQAEAVGYIIISYRGKTEIPD